MKIRLHIEVESFNMSPSSLGRAADQTFARVCGSHGTFSVWIISMTLTCFSAASTHTHRDLLFDFG